MSRHRSSPYLDFFLYGVFAIGSLAACSGDVAAPELTSSPPEGLEWGEGGPSFLAEVKKVEAYSGSSAAVIEAQDRLPTGEALHSKVILRSCGPLGGVCHNRKEYPDLRTAANFLLTIGAPCNVQSGTPEGAFDRCERRGDRIHFDDTGKGYEIGWVEYIAGEYSEEDSANEVAGLHLHLGDAIKEDDFPRYYSTARFSRSFVAEGKVEDLGIATYAGNWHRYEEGRHLVVEVPNYRVDVVNGLLAELQQGDLNRNGIFGARPNDQGEQVGPVSMIEAGEPETSYLVARLRGHMQGQVVPGTRMPLANTPFSVPEMLALFCFIEGIPANADINLESDIDYQGCSYSDPETHSALAIEGAGKNWSDRVGPLLGANCGGCHSAERPGANLALTGDGVYEELLKKTAIADPLERPMISPGDPGGSYLFLKLIGDSSIAGKGMPIDPLEGVRTLSEEELSDIESWILDGAAP